MYLKQNRVLRRFYVRWLQLKWSRTMQSLRRCHFSYHCVRRSIICLLYKRQRFNGVIGVIGNAQRSKWAWVAVTLFFELVVIWPVFILIMSGALILVPLALCQCHVPLLLLSFFHSVSNYYDDGLRLVAGAHCHLFQLWVWSRDRVDPRDPPFCHFCQWNRWI